MTLSPTRPMPAVAAGADAAAATTIAAEFARAVAHSPDGLLVVDGETRLDRGRVAELAGGIQSLLVDAGVGPGDVVTVQLPNRWVTIAALHAIWGLGAVVNPVTPIYRESELRAILASAEPRAVLVPSAYRDVDYPALIRDALAGTGHRTTVIPLDLDPARPLLGPLVPADGSPDEIALLMYTSGTTGTPKGVLHTHRTLLTESRSIAEVFDLDGDSVFMPSPLSHVTGLLYAVLMPLVMDGSAVLLDRWDPDAAVAAIEREGCTATVSATPFLRGLVEGYGRRGGRSSLRVFVCGGADIPAALVEEAESVMGTRISRTYGSTEMPTLCVVRHDDPPAVRSSSEGRVIGAARARLSDIVDGVGELEATGPELFAGYLDPDDNLAAFTDDGWFRTGDLARIGVHGEVAIAGRLKDLIVRGGENIGAKELEDLLIGHPDVRDIAVVGLPDDRMGERVCAVVVTGGAAFDLAAMTSYLAATGIARQKFPEALLLVDELPRTVSGKVQKFQLRAAAVAARARGEIETRA